MNELTKWNYNDSIKKVKQFYFKWKNLNIEVIQELYIARQNLSKTGRRWTKSDVIIGTNVPLKTWEDYCIDSGIEKRTANRWLEMYVPEKKQLLSDKEYKEVKIKNKKTAMVKKSESLPSSIFDIIYADPPWKYDKDEAYFGQTVESHYKPMEPEEIYNLPIQKMSADDCVLYLWCTAPKLNIGLKVIEAWGFSYKTCLIWDKVKHNMGHYSSVRHELLLIGGKGISAPTDKSYANQTDSVYVEERTEHSKKPEYYYDMIEKMHPLKTKRIELFARNKRDKWHSWGNEI